MSEGKLTMFGKSFTTVGSTDANFLIRTKGDLKVQWGSKFIDVIKNGKIIQQDKALVQIVSDSEQISGDGVFIVPKEENDEVWVSSGGTKINLVGDIETTYVSYLVPQEITPDQKYLALTNAGFYYQTLSQAQQSKISAGIIYVEGEKKLYIASNGVLSEYLATSKIELQNDLEKLTIKSLKIFNRDKETIFSDSSSIRIQLSDNSIIRFGSNIVSYVDVSINQDRYLQSYGATNSSGYRLYVQNGRSILEVDRIIERQGTLREIVLDKEQVYGTKENIIVSSYKENGNIQCMLKYTNEFPSEGTVYISLVPLDQSGAQKRTIQEYTIANSQGQYLEIEVDQDLQDKFITNSTNSKIVLANDKLMKFYQNNIDLIDRTKNDETIHTRIGKIQEEELESLKKCPEEQEKVEVGIYSDNFIGLNSILYDPVFKKRCGYPRYDESMEIPPEPDNEEYKLNVPNIEWVQKLIDIAIPRGTITMFSGTSEIPKGWALCDGTNGTPNLVGKFVKGAESLEAIGDIASELSEDNELTLQEKHLPKHTHPHQSHTHIIEETLENTSSSGTLTLELDNQNYVTDIQTSELQVVIPDEEGVSSETIEVISEIQKQGGTASGGNHSHSLSISQQIQSSTSQEEELEWLNTPIKIEPRSYSLVFIMKL